MIKHDILLKKIKEAVKMTAPDATIILYGSFARGEQEADSDIDLLILLNKDQISRQDEKRIKYPLYELEFETGQIISPIVLSKSIWERKHRITPFYKNVTREGIVL